MTQPESRTCFVRGDWESISGIHRFCHDAMATTFEIIILHKDSRYAKQAARAAFDELDRLEAELSKFVENSDITRINNLAAHRPLRIGLAAFECLQFSVKIHNETNGAFDITIGSRYQKPDVGISTGRLSVEYPIKLDEAQYTVEVLTSTIQIDLGGIGKGYAVDKMAELLQEWSIDTALISGGYSSVLALDAPPERDPILQKDGKMGIQAKGWPVTLSNPNNHKQILSRLYLQRRAVSASGLQKGQHIIDPRTSRPVQDKLAAWACAGDAATADALSTAFMVMSPDEIKQFCQRHPNVQAMVILPYEGKEPQKEKVLQFGRWDNSVS